MTATEIELVVIETERRWRERTPATRVDEVNASYRVARGEMRRWCSEHGIKLDEFDPNMQDAWNRMYKRLRKEFPSERWE